MLAVITENNVPIHFIASHLCSNLNLRTDMFTDASPLGMYHIVFVNEPVLLEWRINKTENTRPWDLAATTQYAPFSRITS